MILWIQGGYTMIKELIQLQKKKLSINNDTIARELDVNPSTVFRWMNGETKRIPLNKLTKLSQLHEIPLNSFIEENKHLVKPILGKVRAGYDLLALENISGYEEVSESESLRGDYYLIVDGDSMSGSLIYDGDLVYVKQTNSIESGQIGVIMIGEEVTIKKVIFKDQLMILEATNPSVENRYFTETEVEQLPVKIIGRIVHSKRLFD